MARSMLASSAVSRLCSLDCSRTPCRNWTCKNYSQCLKEE